MTRISELFQCLRSSACDGFTLALLIERGDLAYLLAVVGCLAGVVIIAIVLAFRDRDAY